MAAFSGIGTAIKLDMAGIRDWVMLEAGDGVGGAWHWNTYPGIGVDIPSFSYQFSFEQRSDWSRVYAPGNELKAYAEHCMDEYGLRTRTRLNTAVSGATFDEENHFWRLDIADGAGDHRPLRRRRDRHLQPARSRRRSPGSTASPARSCTRPAGTMTRTCAASGSAIIGTGASAVQIIPSIAPEVEHLTVFQRTPIWCLPKPDRPLSPRAQRALERVPGAQRAARALSQAYVELNFPLPAHFHGIVPLATAPKKWSAKTSRSRSATRSSATS